MDIKAVFFDADGVLIDSCRGAEEALRLIAKEMGLREPTRGELAESWGWPFYVYIKKLWPTLDITKFNEFYYNKFCLHEKAVAPVEGAVSVLLELKKQNYFLGLISSRQKESIFRLFRKADINIGIFDFIQCLEDCPVHKPDPAVFNEAVLKAGRKKIKESEILYVGDHLVDLEACRGRGRGKMRFVAVLSGVISKERFLKAGLKRKNILDSVAAVPDFFKRK